MTKTPVLPVHMRREGFEPDPELRRLRTEGALTRVPLHLSVVTGANWAWLVTRHEDVREVLSDSGRFSSAALAATNRPPSGEPGAGAPDGLPAPGPPRIPMISDDPPDHTRLRRMLTPEFTVRRLRHLQPRVEAIVTEHLDAMEAAGPPVDLVQAFALPIPSLVICELLGVPYTDREEFQRRSNARLDISLDLDERMAIALEARRYMAELVARRRREPTEDMLGMLVTEHGDELTDEELSGLGDLLLLAGHETTSNMLGVGTALLLRHPDQLALVRDNPDLVENAVEELMRYLSIVQATLRMATTDVVLSGQTIRAGEIVLCSLPAGNRDDALGPDLDRLDVTRKPTPHVAFGHGVHHCLGAPLARMEMRAAFPALLRRFPTLRLAVPFEEVSYRTFSFVYGVRSLPVAW